MPWNGFAAYDNQEAIDTYCSYFEKQLSERSRLQMEEASSVMNREDMDPIMDKPIDNSVGALDHFSNGGIVALLDNTPGLREGRQPLNGSDHLLSDKLSIVGRISRDELLYGLDIFNRPTSPHQRGHWRS
jgi:hypothetical protein